MFGDCMVRVALAAAVLTLELCAHDVPETPRLPQGEAVRQFPSCGAVDRMQTMVSANHSLVIAIDAFVNVARQEVRAGSCCHAPHACSSRGDAALRAGWRHAHRSSGCDCNVPESAVPGLGVVARGVAAVAVLRVLRAQSTLELLALARRGRAQPAGQEGLRAF